MKEALTKPDCIALSEEKAMQYFGKFDCIGRELSVVYGDKVEMKRYLPYISFMRSQHSVLICLVILRTCRKKELPV